MIVLKKYIRYIVPFIFLFFIFLCSRLSALAEFYMQYCYPFIATVLSSASFRSSGSLLDCLIFLAVIAFFGSLVFLVLKKLSFRRWADMFVLCVVWLIVWFYMAWGIAYFRPNFNERFGIGQPVEDKAYFETLVRRYIDSLNSSYVACPYLDVRETGRVIEYAYEECREMLRLPYPCGMRRAKYTLMEGWMTKMGIAGFFDPFFNELQVNHYLLPVSYPFTLAHETAHQFGIAGEAECNLYASIICCSSEYPLVRYSGYLQTVSCLLDNLREISPENYREIYAAIDPRVIDDYRKIREHWQKALNPVWSDRQNRVYDAYLKTNKQQSGILSYSEMAGLLVSWEKLKENSVDKTQ
jgi:hypothetical protein